MKSFFFFFFLQLSFDFLICRCGKSTAWFFPQGHLIDRLTGVVQILSLPLFLSHTHSKLLYGFAAQLTKWSHFTCFTKRFFPLFQHFSYINIFCYRTQAEHYIYLKTFHLVDTSFWDLEQIDCVSVLVPGCKRINFGFYCVSLQVAIQGTQCFFLKKYVFYTGFILF